MSYESFFSAASRRRQGMLNPRALFFAVLFSVAFTLIKQFNKASELKDASLRPGEFSGHATSSLPVETLDHATSSLPVETLDHATSFLPIATVGYAVTLSNCKPSLASRLFDAATVLKRSIELASYPRHPQSRYAAKFYALTLEGNALGRCTSSLELAGFELLKKPRPIDPDKIETPEGSVLNPEIKRDGCCGDTELIKLSVYDLIQHPIGVHLDFDTLVLRPLDELFDAIMFPPTHPEGVKARRDISSIFAPTYIPPTPVENMTFDAFYTKDYNMIPPYKSHRVGMQGGFMVVRTNSTLRSELLSMVLSGHYYPGVDAKDSGWFRSGYGKHIWGSMTIQGLLAYYYDLRAKNTSVELNRCKYNQIADNPRVSTFSKSPKFPRGTLLPWANTTRNYTDLGCRDGRENCDDVNCQMWPLNDTRLVHYTYCKVPWKCVNCHYYETFVQPKCYEMQKEWFRVRTTLHGEPSEGGSGEFCKEHFLGFCNAEDDYISMERRNVTSLPDNYVVKDDTLT